MLIPCNITPTSHSGKGRAHGSTRRQRGRGTQAGTLKRARPNIFGLILTRHANTDHTGSRLGHLGACLLVNYSMQLEASCASAAIIGKKMCAGLRVLLCSQVTTAYQIPRTPAWCAPVHGKRFGTTKGAISTPVETGNRSEHESARECASEFQSRYRS